MLNRFSQHLNLSSRDYAYAKELLHSIPVSKETKQKRSISMIGKNKGNTAWNKGVHGLYICSKETKEKLSIKSSGENNGMHNKKHTKEAKKLIGDKNRGENNGLKKSIKKDPNFIKGENNHASKSYKIITPNNEIIIIKGLRKYCEQHNLFHSNMIKVANGKQKHHRQYKCERI